MTLSKNAAEVNFQQLFHSVQHRKKNIYYWIFIFYFKYAVF